MQRVSFQQSFSDGLLDADLPPPAGLTAWNGATASRFGVYRNNVVVGLTEALRRRFPVCERLVGEEFFRAMARAFVRAAPPRSPVLALYGDAFADFIAAFAPAACVPYLADVTRLEYACGLAYHAADATPIAFSRLQDLPQEHWRDLVFDLHPSVRLVASSWPIVSIWATNTHDADVKPVDLSVAEDALIVRPGLDVEVRRLPPGGLAFLAALQNGEPLAAAAKAGLSASADFDLPVQLVELMTAGLAVAVRSSFEARHRCRACPTSVLNGQVERARLAWRAPQDEEDWCVASPTSSC